MKTIPIHAPARRSDEPYVMSMLDRWLILVGVVAASLLFFKPLYGYSIYFRGVSFEESFQFAAASTYYQKATDEDAQIPEAWNARAELHLMRAGATPSEYQTAVQVFAQGIAANPGSELLRFDLCRAYYEVGHDDRGALRACRDAVRLDSGNAFAWDYAGWASIGLGDRWSAIGYWRHVLALQPHDAAIARAIARYGSRCAC